MNVAHHFQWRHHAEWPLSNPSCDWLPGFLRFFYGFVTSKGHFIMQTLFTNWLYIRFFSFDGGAAEPVKVQSRLSNDEKRRCCGYNCFIRFSLITARFLAVFYDSSSLTCRLSSWPACSGEEGFSLRGERSIKNKSSSRSEATPRSFFPVAAASSSRLFSHLFSSFLSSVSRLVFLGRVAAGASVTAVVEKCQWASVTRLWSWRCCSRLRFNCVDVQAFYSILHHHALLLLHSTL